MEAARVLTVSQSSLTRPRENRAATLAGGSSSSINLALNDDREAEHGDLIRADLKELDWEEVKSQMFEKNKSKSSSQLIPPPHHTSAMCTGLNTVIIIHLF